MIKQGVEFAKVDHSVMTRLTGYPFLVTQIANFQGWQPGNTGIAPQKFEKKTPEKLPSQ